jgi:hypothetical protein
MRGAASGPGVSSDAPALVASAASPSRMPPVDPATCTAEELLGKRVLITGIIYSFT